MNLELPELGPYHAFVYGTLKPGGHYWPRYVEGKASISMPAMIHGTIYHLAAYGYPGVRLGGNAWVHGYVHRFEARQSMLDIDHLEGFAPNLPEERCEYIRKKITAFDPSGDPFGEVWVYEMTEAKINAAGGIRIPSGNWRASAD